MAAADSGGLGLGGGREGGEKGEEEEGGPIPLLTSGGGGLWRAGDGGWRRWPAMAVAAVLQTWRRGERWWRRLWWPRAARRPSL